MEQEPPLEIWKLKGQGAPVLGDSSGGGGGACSHFPEHIHRFPKGAFREKAISLQVGAALGKGPQVAAVCVRVMREPVPVTDAGTLRGRRGPALAPEPACGSREEPKCQPQPSWLLKPESAELTRLTTAGLPEPP